MIYMDSAATSLLKPPQVSRAMIWAMKHCTSPGRGAHKPAMNAADTVLACREAAAELFHVSMPEQVVFTSSATHGLNLAIRSLVKPGDRVVISGYEHNAVVRPLYAIGAVVDIVDTALFTPDEMLHRFALHIPGASAVVCSHVSNVFGYVLPIERIAEMCAENQVPLIVDASQSAGILDIDFQQLGAEYVAMPGHKGLMGPQGTGLLLCKNGGEPLVYGGTGSMSALVQMPDILPDRLEAGTHNVCGIAGLREGIEYIRRTTPASIKNKEESLMWELLRMLDKKKGLICFSAENPSVQCGVVSVIHEKFDSEEFAERLACYGIAARAGLHCAPLAHRTAGTIETGTLRLSLSPFLTLSEIRKAADIIRKI